MKIFTFVTIFFLCFFLAADPVKPAHQFELEKHIGVKPVNFYGTPMKTLEAPEYTPITEKLIFGYLPYWTNGTDHLRYSLITDLLYFSCELGSNGSLGNCHSWPESAPIDEAHKYGVRVHLVITGFDGATVQTLVENESYKTIFFENCWNQVNNNGADGINIDFESFANTKTEDLTNFFNDLGEYFHSRNSEMIISAALPAVDWSDRWDMDAMTGMDYFFLMLYDYHWSGSDPGPVAPLISESPWSSGGICVTRSINDYIDDNGSSITAKLIAGYPYYGKKWKSVDDSIPGTKVENANSVTYDEIHTDYSSITTQYDSGSETPYKIWQEGSTWYQLWFDDADSLDLKFAFVNDKSLGGSGMWALNYDGTHENIWKKIALNYVKDRTGSFDNPVMIGELPFTSDDNTYRYVSDKIDRYICNENTSDTSGIDEAGPEIVYEVNIECSGTLTAEITDGEGGNSEREDIDIHILTGTEGNTCKIRADVSVQTEVEKGICYIVADSYRSGDKVMGGPFSISVDFSPSDPVNECENGTHDCDENETCVDTPCSFICEIKENNDDNDTILDEENDSSVTDEEDSQSEEHDSEANESEIQDDETSDERTDSDSEGTLADNESDDSEKKSSGGCSVNAL